MDARLLGGPALFSEETCKWNHVTSNCTLNRISSNLQVQAQEKNERKNYAKPNVKGKENHVIPAEATQYLGKNW